MRKIFLAILFVAACGGSEKPAPESPENNTADTDTAAGDCDGAIAHAVTILRADMGEKLTEDQYTQVNAALVESCKAEWSPEAIACVNDAPGHEELQECRHMFSDEVADKLDARMEEIFDGAGRQDANEPE